MKRLLPLTVLSVLLIAAGTPAGQVIENTATYEDDQGRTLSNTVRVAVQAVCAAELTPDAITRSVRPGDPVTVPFTLTNTGNDTRTFPLTLSGTDSNLRASVQPGDLVPQRDAPGSVTLDPDQSVTLLVTGTALGSGQRTVTLTTGCQNDLTGTLTLNAQHQPPLITKTVAGPTTVEGDVTYTIRVTNPEAVPMTDVLVEDLLPATLRFVSVTPDPQVTATPAGDRTRVTWHATLGPAETREYTLRATVTSGTPDDTEISNAASATTEGASATTPPAVVRVFRSRILIQKTVTPLIVDPGGTLTYTVIVTNPSSSAVTDAVLTDQPDPALQVDPRTVTVNGRSAPATLDGGQLRVPLGTLRGGESVTVTYVARGTLPDEDRPLVNRAVASARGHQGTVTATVTSNQSAAHATVRRALGFSGHDLIGRVYVDRDGNHRFDPADTPVPGARVLLAGGREVLTDSSGLYAFANVPAGTHALRLDPRSVPFTPQDRAALNRLWTAGTAVTSVVALTVQDFPLSPNRLSVSGPGSWSSGHAAVTLTPPTFTARALTDAPTCVRIGGHTYTLTRTPISGPLPDTATPQEVTCP